MNGLIQQIFSILTQPPGNLVYHLILAFSIAGGLQLSLIQADTRRKNTSSRLVIGFSILLFCQILLFIISGLAWQGLLSSTLFLPPLDRAISGLSLVWIIWLWVTPEINHPIDSLAIILSLLVIIALGFSINAWQISSTFLYFNSFWLDPFWQGFSLLLILGGFILILIKRPLFAGFSLGFLSLGLIGHLIQFLFPLMDSNYPGIVRLTQMIAYPFLLVLPQRLNFPDGISSPPIGLQARPSVQERRRYSADSKAANALLQLAVEADTPNIFPAITHSIGQVMLADLCFLVSINQDDKHIKIEGGFNLIREENLESCLLDREKMPLVSNAFLRGHGLRLKADHKTTPDLQTLALRYGLNNPGDLLAVPLHDQNHTSLGGIILLSPYSNRTWNKEDQTYLSKMAVSIAEIYTRFIHPVEKKETGKLQENFNKAILQVDQLQKEVIDLKTANVILQEIPSPDPLPHSPRDLVDIETIVDQAISTLSSKMREKYISLRVDIPEELPQLVTDQTTFQQVMIDLLENACTITPPEETIQIKIRSIDETSIHPRILIQVTNRGGAIPEEERKRFFSVVIDSDSHPIQGVGNPDELIAAKALIMAQGGRMWIESEEPSSTIINVMIPCKAPLLLTNQVNSLE
jgi:hypothetical protein